MTGPYDDMLYLPHHVSKTRQTMPVSDRAAQFAPFAALTGYEAAIRESGRLTTERIELSEEEKQQLDRKLAQALETGRHTAVTYFLPDRRKAGGAYVTAVGRIKRVDMLERVVVFIDGQQIPIEEIISLEEPEV